MKVFVSEPKKGNKYWWIREPNKSPELCTVLWVKDGEIALSMCDAFYGSTEMTVSWNMEEWHAAQNRLCDYKEPVKKKDLKRGEELCHACNGTRWEFTRDSDVLPCIWCSMEGKRKKTKQAEPKITRRSPYHPEIKSE